MRTIAVLWMISVFTTVLCRSLRFFTLQVTSRIWLIDKEIDKVIDLAISGPMLIISMGPDCFLV
jgi:hypothetical protein